MEKLEGAPWLPSEVDVVSSLTWASLGANRRDCKGKNSAPFRLLKPPLPSLTPQRTPTGSTSHLRALWRGRTHRRQPRHRRPPRQNLLPVLHREVPPTIQRTPWCPVKAISSSSVTLIREQFSCPRQPPSRAGRYRQTHPNKSNVGPNIADVEANKADVSADFRKSSPTAPMLASTLRIRAQHRPCCSQL